MRSRCLVIVLPAAWLALASPARTQEPTPVAPALREAVKILREAAEKAVESQKRVEKISDETDQMVSEYRAALKQIDSLQRYNAHVEKLLAAQEEEIASLQGQVEEASLVIREVPPLLQRMVGALDAFVALDAPFLADERQQRVALLRELLGRADVSEAEKYRRVMEAYQIESEYGRTIEAYQGTLETGGKERTVDFLRVGRVALFYQTLDGKEVGVWIQDSKRWEPLPSAFRNPVRQAIRIARKQAAPDLVTLPIPAPKDTR